jgi:hypothetical protein
MPYMSLGVCNFFVFVKKLTWLQKNYFYLLLGDLTFPDVTYVVLNHVFILLINSTTILSLSNIIGMTYAPKLKFNN